jgi:hypothetical protein
MGSMQWEDTAFYAKRRTASHGNGTRTNSSELRCKATSEERSAGNLHATFRGSRRRVTASGHPVLGVRFPGPTHQNPYIRRLENFFEEHGGIADVLLTHRDDVCDADKYAARFASGAWIHEADLSAAPFASDIITGDSPRTILPGRKSYSDSRTHRGERSLPGRGSISFHR